MEWSVLYMGPLGAGKTTAIRVISDIDVVNTDEVTTRHVANIKSHTTVCMDMGMMKLGGTDKLRLFGAPGHDRFDFMWDILLAHSKGVVLVINHSAVDPLADLDHHLAVLEERASGLPLVIGISHRDKDKQRPFDIYESHFRTKLGRAPEDIPPIVSMDARSKKQVRSTLVAMTALLEMHERFPKSNARA